MWGVDGELHVNKVLARNRSGGCRHTLDSVVENQGQVSVKCFDIGTLHRMAGGWQELKTPALRCKGCE